MKSEGIYLINKTGEMFPLHTANGGGDEELLEEYLEEWDLGIDND